jgi:hypothetical protein
MNHSWRNITALGFLGLGVAFIPSGGCGSTPPVAEMPVRFAEPIRSCAVMHEHHLTATDHTAKFDVGLVNGQVDSIVLVQSTLADEELEACLARAIRSFIVDDLPLRHSASLEGEFVQPESRALFGNPAVAPLAACLASPPCLLGLVVVMGATVITVQLSVYSATATAPAIATPATTATPVPTTTTTATPTATATTTTTSPPIVLPRRWPGQTCENTELDQLGKVKDTLCNAGYAAKCSGNEDKLKKTPCSLVLLSIVQRQACLAARWDVQNKCFGGKPDDRHWPPLNQTQDGINNCEALKLIVCAQGHPMAGK